MMAEAQTASRDREARAIGSILAEMGDVVALRTWRRRARATRGPASHPRP